MKKKLLWTLILGLSPLAALQAEPTQLVSGTKVQLIDETSYNEETQMTESPIKKFEKYIQGSRDILKQFESFMGTVNDAKDEKDGLTEEDANRIIDAAIYAAECHQFQTRKNPAKTPYITHPLGVAESLLTLGKVRDADVIIGALLHDTVEDTQATFKDIRTRFGDKVEGYVREVTDDKSLSTQKRKKLQIINAPHKSPGATLIKLSDKLYNLNNLLYDAPADWSRERIDQYFQWAQAVIDNLPEVQTPLREEVRKVILEYWQNQA